MPCYKPIPARQDGPGQRVILWPELHTENLALPCGKCIGCKASKATAWAHRCGHEASLWDYNTFLTLTYDERHLPEQGHLSDTDLTNFLKRLRKYAASTDTNLLQTQNSSVRYFACGEYGRENGRPHFHVLLFNCDFSDGYKVAERGQHDLFQSDTLHTLWPDGTANYGKATRASANYIAQYTLKKQGLNRSTDCDEDGVERPPPFLRMSLKPAIGSKWLEHYKGDLTHGYLLDEGHKNAIPRTYKNKLKKQGDPLIDTIELAIAKNKLIETPEQLRAHEIIHRRLKELTERRG